MLGSVSYGFYITHLFMCRASQLLSKSHILSLSEDRYAFGNFSGSL